MKKLIENIQTNSIKGPVPNTASQLVTNTQSMGIQKKTWFQRAMNVLKKGTKRAKNALEKGTKALKKRTQKKYS
jgi:hypothetical protein